jgi:hypothetical protein
MHKKLTLVLAMLVLLLVPFTAAAQAPVEESAGQGILGLFIAVASTLIVAFGVGGLSLRSTVSKIHKDNVDFEAVDKAVEKMLLRVGIPSKVGDIIGDIVAQLATRGPELIGKSFFQIVKEIFIDEMSRRSAMDVASMSGGEIEPRLVANRTSRIRVAEDIASSNTFRMVVESVTPKSS